MHKKICVIYYFHLKNILLSKQNIDKGIVLITFQELILIGNNDRCFHFLNKIYIDTID